MTAPLAAGATFPVATRDGAMLPVYALGGPEAAPGVLFAHANGLAAGSYGPWLAGLARRLRVFAFDARGHGASRWPEGPLEAVFHVDRFADDLELVAGAVAERLGGAALHYAGHSLGAAAALRLGLCRGGSLPWASTLLFEPPIFPPPHSPHYAEASRRQLALIERSAARRERWPSPEALCLALRTRGPFQRVRPDLLAAHSRATLRPLPEGGYTLCCPAAIESAIFRSHRSADTWQRLPALGAPIRLVSGDPTLPERGWVSLVMPEMAAALPGAQLATMAGAGHLMVLEEPEACGDLLLAAIEKTR